MDNQMIDDFANLELAFSELAQFGDGALAYIKQISLADARELVGEIPDVPKNVELYCLFGADGTPLSISDSHALAFENAFEHDLKPIALH